MHDGYRVIVELEGGATMRTDLSFIDQEPGGCIHVVDVLDVLQEFIAEHRPSPAGLLRLGVECVHGLAEDARSPEDGPEPFRGAPSPGTGEGGGRGATASDAAAVTGPPAAAAAGRCSSPVEGRSS